jgi:GT2 family glycosyltransferase
LHDSRTCTRRRRIAEPRISVILPTHQRRHALSLALASLRVQSVPASSYEVIVAVDRSTDGTWEMLCDMSTPYELRPVLAAGPGRASACNEAIRLARGEIVVILDDDMTVASDFLASHAAHHPPGSRLCVLGPVPIELHASSPRAAAYVQSKFAAHLKAIAEPGHIYTARDFYSGNASIRRDVMLEVGGFDESFAEYGNEDVDLAVRLRAGGVTLTYDPAAAARQEYSKDLRALALDTFAKGRTTVLLARKHPASLESLRLAAPWDASRPWLAARAALLALARHHAGTPAAAIRLAAHLERLGLWRQPLFYRAVLDYAFWAGAELALGEASDEIGLDRLAKDIRRGPIDLLLHG